MERNVGSVDRAIRIVVGAVLVAWALFGQGDYHLWGWVGVLPLATGILARCPAYLPFGLRSCEPR